MQLAALSDRYPARALASRWLLCGLYLCFTASPLGCGTNIHCGADTVLSGDTCVVPGTDAGSASDAGTVTPINWSLNRGTPIPVAAVGTFSGSMFALTDSQIVMQGGSSCNTANPQASQSVCNYTWLGDDGGVSAAANGMTVYADDYVSPNALFMVVREETALATCANGTPIQTGSVDLYDLITGLPLWKSPSFYGQSLGTASAFTDASDWFDALQGPSSTGDPCPAALPYAASVAAPIGGSSAEPLADRFAELPDLRWLVSSRSGSTDSLGLVDPTNTSTFQALGTGYDPASLQLRANGEGWIQLTGSQAGQGVILSLTIASSHLDSFMPAANQQLTSASGRWELLAGPGLGDWTARDALGQISTRTFSANDTNADPLLAGSGNLVVYQEVGSANLTLLNLNSGAKLESAIVAKGASLITLSDHAAVAAKGFFGDVWLLTSAGALQLETTAAQVDNVRAVPVIAGGSAQLLIERGGAGSGSGANESLDLWDGKSGELITLSNDLYFTAPTGLSGAPLDDCSEPYLSSSTRGGGLLTSTLYFAERSPADPAQATLFVMPLDRSSAPRSLGTLASAACKAPLVSSSGARVGVWTHGPANPGDWFGVASYSKP